MPMNAITIHDRIGLVDLLAVLRLSVERSTWVCHHVEVSGSCAAMLNTSEMPQDRLSIPGSHLFRDAECIQQIFDGDFSAYIDEAAQPWLTIRSIRGAYFVVIADETVLRNFRTRFADVRDSPADVGYFVA